MFIGAAEFETRTAGFLAYRTTVWTLLYVVSGRFEARKPNLCGHMELGAESCVYVTVLYRTQYAETTLV